MESKIDKTKTVNQTHEDSSSSQNSRQQNSQYQGSEKQPPSHKEESLPTNWFRILEVSESATKIEISTAYKKIIGQYHPDKVATLGQELRALAEFKSKQINAAYDYALKLRG
jgi:DnaJ like chaperone protein